MSDLPNLTIAQARDRLRGGDLSAADLTEACLAEVEAARALNAFVHHTPRDCARAGGCSGRAVGGW